MNFTPDQKVRIVSAWFNEIEGTINELENISTNKYYKKIAAPTLYSLLERMAWFRYRQEYSESSKRFKKLLFTYSNLNSALEKIDLAFLYHWDDSEHRETPKYKKAIEKIHKKIKIALSELYGTIDTHMVNRFIDPNTLYQDLIRKNTLPDCLTLENLQLFSACEVIYRFGRCKMVHQGEFVSTGFIDIDLLIHLTKNIANNLKSICIENKKFADELE